MSTLPEYGNNNQPQVPAGETNGGPLGCCLGVLIGLVLSLSVVPISAYYAHPLIHTFGDMRGLTVRIILVCVAIIAMLICGKLGWIIGKKTFKEYER